MTVTHGAFSVERTCKAQVKTCWNAWTNPEMKKRWFAADMEGWETLEFGSDVRTDGREFGQWRDSTGTVHGNETKFLDIVEHERIAFAYTMAMNSIVHSASLAIVTFQPTDEATKIIYTEQGAYFSGSDGTESRIGGVGWLYDKFKQQVENEASP